MKLLLRLSLVLTAITATGAFASVWQGPLVDSKCYTSLQNNTSIDAGYTGVDLGGKIRYCAPTAKTRRFAVVQQDGSPLRLDAAGNEQALEMVQKRGVKRTFVVAVSGDRYRHSVLVRHMGPGK